VYAISIYRPAGQASQGSQISRGGSRVPVTHQLSRFWETDGGLQRCPAGGGRPGWLLDRTRPLVPGEIGNLTIIREVRNVASSGGVTGLSCTGATVATTPYAQPSNRGQAY